jgi:hypothetical protein
LRRRYFATRAAASVISTFIGSWAIGSAGGAQEELAILRVAITAPSSAREWIPSLP